MINLEVLKKAKKFSLLGRKLDVIAALIEEMISELRDSNFAEFGVYKGGAAYYLASKCNGTVSLFDTFAGMPKTDPSIDFHKENEFSETSIDKVKLLLNEFANVEYNVGFFPESIIQSKIKTFGLVHIDADIYKSTLDGLIYFYERLLKNGIIILDDWNWSHCKGVNLAIKDFLKNININDIETIEVGNQFIIRKLV